MKSKDNLVGKQFGRWTVLEETDLKNSDGRKLYLCRCSCENHTEKLVSGKNLRTGHSQSCGCLRYERLKEANIGNKHGQANAKDLTGQKFGHLTALRRLDTKAPQGCWEWECLCDCGEITISNTRDLNAKRKTRCEKCSSEATTSKGEEAIIQLLDDNGIVYEREVKFETCIFPDTQQFAKFDFYIKKDNYLIEFDGEQHYKMSKTSGWAANKERIIYRDSIKNQWCKDNNIKLIRIPYYHLYDLTIKDLIPETSQFLLA